MVDSLPKDFGKLIVLTVVKSDYFRHRSTDRPIEDWVIVVYNSDAFDRKLPDRFDTHPIGMASS